jgi:hypothetical protein
MDTDRKYIVKFIGSDDTTQQTVIGDEGVFVVIASMVFSYLNEIEEENRYDKSYEKVLKKLVRALKTGKWENLIEPSNTFFYEVGNMERFEVADYSCESEHDYSSEYAELMERCEELKLQDLVAPEDE